MKTILKKSNTLILSVLFFCIVSCNKKIDFNQYQSVSEKGWKANDKMWFHFIVKDTITPKNLFINIRNNKEYLFSNLYVITELTFPNETTIIDTLQYEMTDKTGRFLGTGFTEIKENKLFYKAQKIFPLIGRYTFNIRHAMRKNGAIHPIPYLKGIQEIGLSIEN